MSGPFDTPLRAGAEALGLSLQSQQVAQLGSYLTMLQKWNKVYNLTAVRDPAEMLTHHLLDSLAVVGPLLRQQPVGTEGFDLLDVGSGAGLPGAVIAICCPEVRVTCVDTVAKKVAFQQQVAFELRLPNFRGMHTRVEELADPYQVVCSRAFASLVDFTRWSRAAVAPGGLWMAMKGKQPAEELAALPGDVDVFHVEQLTVPGLDAERCIVWMRPQTANS